MQGAICRATAALKLLVDVAGPGGRRLPEAAMSSLNTGWLVVQVDPVFEGADGGQSSLVKYNPLSNVSSAEVWNFLRVMVRPMNRFLRIRPAQHLSKTWLGGRLGLMVTLSSLHVTGSHIPHEGVSNSAADDALMPLTSSCFRRVCRPTRCTRRATSPLAASRARGRCCPTSTSGRAAGGGRCAFDTSHACVSRCNMALDQCISKQPCISHESGQM